MKKTIFTLMAVMAMACTMSSCDHSNNGQDPENNPVMVRDTADLVFTVFTHTSAFDFMDITLHYTDPKGQDVAILLNEQKFAPADKLSDEGKKVYNSIASGSFTLNPDSIFEGVKTFSFTQKGVTNWTTKGYYTIVPKQQFTSDAKSFHFVSYGCVVTDPSTTVCEKYESKFSQHAFIGIETTTEAVNGICDALLEAPGLFDLTIVTGKSKKN